MDACTYFAMEYGVLNAAYPVPLEYETLKYCACFIVKLSGVMFGSTYCNLYCCTSLVKMHPRGDHQSVLRSVTNNDI